MLTSKQRAYLRGLAAHEDTIVHIGKGGITENIIIQMTDALKARELVKGRVLEDDNSQVVYGHDGSRVRSDRDNPRVEIEIAGGYYDKGEAAKTRQRGAGRATEGKEDNNG
jgi:hypothetical protein